MMNDYIKREDVLESIDGFLAVDRFYHPYSKGKTIPTGELIQRVKTIPSADVVERNVGKWMAKTRWYQQTFDECTCSECGAVEYFNVGWKKFNFCPNCGADMRPTQANDSNALDALGNER